MQRFAQLYARLDATTGTRGKVDALKAYLVHAPAADAAWAVYFLAGGKPRRTVSSTLLRQWAAHAAGVDDWLFDASYQAVGDLAETIAHLLPPSAHTESLGLADWMSQRLLPLRDQPADEQARQVMQWLADQDWAGRFLIIKLIGGGFRVGLSRQLVVRALAEHAGVPSALVAQRMMGYTDKRHEPSAEAFNALIAPVPEGAPDAQALGAVRSGQPFPFFLAHALPPEGPEGMLSPSPDDWLAEWKFDGIRAQIVRHGPHTCIWSRGEELITEQFPDIAQAAAHWPDGTVLDGEIVVRLPEAVPGEPEGLAAPWLSLPVYPAPFGRLQQRLGRQSVSPRMLRDHPAVFIAYDVLAWQGEDVRNAAQSERRLLLDTEVAPRCHVVVSPLVSPDDTAAPPWTALGSARDQARALGVEGLMLKHRDTRYGVGRTKNQGAWWKWKLDPLSVDVVLTYAQAGHGRRASLYTDYTFAVWNRPPRDALEADEVVQAIAAGQAPDPAGLQLVTLAKAYSGLTDEEIRSVDRIVRRDTLNKFGPVRSLRPTQVFELGFEGVNESRRHKCGVAVRFPRILRWRQDKPLHEADSLDTVRALLRQGPGKA